jgi:RNA polymerase sigma factor (sigma-70 family)
VADLPDLAPMAARGERFRAIYEANYHRILGYALRRASEEDAADVVADTFLVAWRRLDAVPEGEAARLWLYGVARRMLANQQRGRRRHDRLSARVLAARDEGFEPPPVAVEPSPAAAAFARLRPDDREVLALLAWEGLDAGEIGSVLGCSRNAARIRIHRARRRFALELERFGRPLKQNPVHGHVSEAYD